MNLTDEARRLAIYQIIKEKLDTAGRGQASNSPNMEEFINFDDDKPNRSESDNEMDECNSSSPGDKRNGKGRSPSAPPPSVDSEEEDLNALEVIATDENMAEEVFAEPGALANSPLPESEEVDLYKLEALRRYIWFVDGVDLLTSILNGILNI